MMTISGNKCFYCYTAGGAVTYLLKEYSIHRSENTTFFGIILTKKNSAFRSKCCISEETNNKQRLKLQKQKLCFFYLILYFHRKNILIAIEHKNYWKLFCKKNLLAFKNIFVQLRWSILSHIGICCVLYVRYLESRE